VIHQSQAAGLKVDTSRCAYTVSVIDLEAKAERVIDKVVVGDAPEAWRSARPASSVALLLRGSNNAKSDWFYNRNGSVVVLKIALRGTRQRRYPEPPLSATRHAFGGHGIRLVNALGQDGCRLGAEDSGWQQMELTFQRREPSLRR
jgi:hypothetical protein